MFAPIISGGDAQSTLVWRRLALRVIMSSWRLKLVRRGDSVKYAGIDIRRLNR